MNPYLAGFFLGLILLITVFVAGRGLGASGGVKSVIVQAVTKVAPEHAENSIYYSKYLKTGESPIKSWLVFELIGVFVGGFLSGAISGRLGWKLDKGNKITNKSRKIYAVIGGILFGIGASFGRGCTSGAALSGMAVLSTAGFLTMIFIFGSGYAFAYFFRKLWI